MHPFMSNEPLLTFTKTMRQHLYVLSLASDWLVVISRWPRSHCKRCSKLHQIKDPWLVCFWPRTLSTTLLTAVNCRHCKNATIEQQSCYQRSDKTVASLDFLKSPSSCLFSSLARLRRSLVASRPKRPLRGQTYSTLKFIRSTSGKSIASLLH